MNTQTITITQQEVDNAWDESIRAADWFVHCITNKLLEHKVEQAREDMELCTQYAQDLDEQYQILQDNRIWDNQGRWQYANEVA